MENSNNLHYFPLFFIDYGLQTNFRIFALEMISINDFAKMVIDISGKNISIKNIKGPTGVRGRRSDNKLIYEKLGWQPSMSLRKGMEKTYAWINEQASIYQQSVVNVNV